MVAWANVKEFAILYKKGLDPGNIRADIKSIGYLFFLLVSS